MKRFSSITYLKEKLLIFFLLLFSLLINQYYGNRGIFPLDSFAHFDTGFRILNGEYPFKDYWVISGAFVDYLQSVFFYFFGINWQSYVLHASFVNSLIVLVNFLVLKNFNLNIYFCFIYSIFLAILAYPSSGTPFVDHHSAFFSLIGIYFLILAVKTEKKLYWLMIPFFFGFAFFSKQVPSSYIIISAAIILIFYSLINKKFNCIKYTALSSFLFILLVLIFGKLQGINFIFFLDQYIFYPKTLGSERYSNIDLSLNNIIFNFKFIYISILPLIYINIKKLFLQKNYFKEKDFLFFLILLFLTFSLILHQLLTKNQIFIFFLIPILISFTHISLAKNRKFSNFFTIVIIAICLFATLKYHLRFNENRKFHELESVNFNLALPGKTIDTKFTGLMWISSEYKNNPNEEINLLLDTKKHLQNDKRKKMLMTHYIFFSTILDQNLFTPTRWFTKHGISHPLKNNKFFNKYQDFFIQKITENNIEVIYTMKSVDSYFPTELLGSKCIQSSSINNILDAHLILECGNLKSK